MNDDNSTLFNNSLTGDDSGSGAAGKQTLEKGATLLGLYRVESDPIEGGMGRVFRVHHAGWNVDLAMKQPKAAAFMTGQQKEAFTAECQHWIDLGLHPHIVSCYYVREIDGIPGIFSEWMEGGSLKQWIYSKEKGQKGRLYEGDDQAVQERILDIAIQFARGLHYAHEQGLIHQDVKPDNLLMTSGGLAKVADFGIANAGAKFAGADSFFSEGGTMVANGMAYTEKYCSPEQMDGRELTRRTDIWSWAVSVLEMYAESSADWANGVVAGYDCDDYINKAPVPVPDAMKDLLRGCFAPSEADRPHDFGVVETGLLKIYESVTGHPYPRPATKAADNTADNTADNLNNHALSFIDIGKPEEAERCWKKAIDITPNHAISLYNQGIYLWKIGKTSDAEILYTLTTRAAKADYCLAMLHLARADAESAIVCLEKAIQIEGETENIKKALATAREMQREGWDGRCLRTFQGHTDAVSSVCFSPDGRLALSGSGDNTLKLWDTETGECLCTYEGHTDAVYSVCFSPDGQWALSGSDDDTLKLWDTETEECLRTFQGHTNCVYSVCFILGKQWVLSGSRDHTSKLWDTQTGECLYTFREGHNEAFYFDSPDGQRRFSLEEQSIRGVWDIKAEKWVRENMMLTLYDVETGECLRTFIMHTVYSHVCYSPDGQRELSESEQYSTLKLRDIETGKYIRTFQGPTKVSSVCFSPDGRRALSGSYDNTMKLWQLPDKGGACEYILSRIHSTESTLKQAERFTSLVAEINELIKNREIAQALSKLEDLKAVRLFGDNRVYATLVKTLMRYCMTGSCTTYQITELYDRFIRSLCFSPDGRQVLSGNDEGFLHLWDLQGNMRDTLNGQHTDDVKSVCFSPDGRRALSGGKDKTLKLWDIETRECLRTFEGHTSDVSSVCFSPDGRLALSGSRKLWVGCNPANRTLLGSGDNTLKLWDTETGECLRTFQGHTHYVESVCFSPYGRLALSGSEDNTLKLWDTETGECLRTFEGHTYGIQSVCFSPDGRLALSGSSETIKLWDTETGACLRTFQGHIGSYVCFSPDGRQALSSGGNDGTPKLWDIQTGKCIHNFQGHTGWVYFVCFSPNGSQIASESSHEILIHDLEYDLHFPGWADWDEGARPYLNIFLTLHPNWTDDDFEKILIPELQHRGYGWLRPEGVRAQLEGCRLWSQFNNSI